MHFLLTNDDGIEAVGLKALSIAALERGHKVTVCAPLTQQSAVSHHLTLSAPLIVREMPWENAKAYAVAGTPADCARLGRLLSDEPIDFVLSGINNGENAGTATYYSGTVSAAREARMCNMPSMAVSIRYNADERTRLALARLAITIAERMKDVAVIEKRPMVEGRNMLMILAPKNEKAQKAQEPAKAGNESASKA